MTVDLFVNKSKRSPTTKVWKSFFREYMPEWELRLCYADEILRGDSRHVIFPGGSGSAFFKTLGKENSSRVVEWVEAGGSYIGVCAGAYLASNHLKITPLKIPDKAWERGLHDVDILMDGQTFTVNYHNGPVFQMHESVHVLATFKSNFLAEGGHYSMMDTPAITQNVYGNGLVSLFSPHLEKSSDEMKSKLATIFEYIESKI